MGTARAQEGFDVIGDVHGHVDKLVGLLRKLGYEEVDGAWRHPRRRAVFVGDLIDRGPGQVECYRIPRAMVDAGAALAVAGNHEYNAVAFHTPDPEHRGAFLRPHTPRNMEQHEEFRVQVPEWSELHDEIVDWFRTLPLWLELDGLRVVHACWDSDGIAVLRERFGETPRLGRQVMLASAREGSDEWRAVEHLLKGPEIDVPAPYVDPNGHTRHRARHRWWDPGADRLDRAAVLPDGAKMPNGSWYPSLPEVEIVPPVRLYADPTPVVFGHYWQTGQPMRMTPRTACVDYSAGRNGPLVAYRWSGESTLDDAYFVASPEDDEA